MKAAFHVARTGRCGPVLVDVPRDIQEAEFDFRYPDEVDLPGWKPPRRGHARQIEEAAAAIARAERPDPLRRRRHAQRAMRAPSCASSRSGAAAGGHDADGEERLSGDARAVLRVARHARAEVVELGAEQGRPHHRLRLALRRPGHRASCRRSRRGPASIHLDIDAAEIGKLRHADIPVVGPLKQVLATSRPSCSGSAPQGSAPKTEPWLRQIADWRDEFPLRYSRKGDMLKPQHVVEALRDLTAGRDDFVWTTGVGQHQMWAMQYLVCDRPRTFITSGGLGTMGYGLPAAVGAKAARPDATVVCIDGDGCFQMTCQELATAVLENLPIVVVIVNNGYLGMVQQWQDMFFEERLSQVHLTHQVPDYAQLAEAYGAKGYTIGSVDELDSSRRRSPSARPGRSSSTPGSTRRSSASR